MFKVIVLDFDGVVLESNHIKNHAFDTLFSAYPEHYEAMMAFHAQHHHMSRYDKFEHLYQRYFKKTHPESLVADWIEQFAQLTRKAIVSCDFVEGTEAFLAAYQGVVPLYIASATPISELTYTLVQRYLDHLFDDFYGNPQNKFEMLSQIAALQNVDRSEMVFVGDSIDDLKIAKQFGCFFIGRISDYQFTSDIVQFNTMNEINHYLSDKVETHALRRNVI